MPALCAAIPVGVDATGTPLVGFARYTWMPPEEPPPGAPDSDVQEFLVLRSYRDGVRHYYNAEVNAANAAGDAALELVLTDRRNHFNQMASDHGVDENTAP